MVFNGNLVGIFALSQNKNFIEFIGLVPQGVRQKSKVKSQKSKNLVYKLLIDLEWLVYLRRAVLVNY